MRITGFIWIEEILDKLLRKHDVQGQEVVEVFDGNPKFRFVEKGNREGEHVTPPWVKRTREGISSYSLFTKKTAGLCQCRPAI
jgi:hypothetical protein